MSKERLIASWCFIVFAASLFGFAGGAEAAEGWRFDCGTADSPVMAGYERLTASDLYDEATGYGWEGCKPASVVFGSPEIPPGKGSEGRPGQLQEYLVESFDDLNGDGVASESDLVFRADVPNGTYRVTVTCRELPASAQGSGRLVELRPRHCGGRGGVYPGRLEEESELLRRADGGAGDMGKSDERALGEGVG